MDSLTVAHFALTPLVVEQILAHRHQLCLEEVAQLTPELSPSLIEVKRLRKVGWDLEGEGHLGLTYRAYVLLETVDHFKFLPGSSLPLVLVPLALVAVIHLTARVDQLKLELNAVGGNGLVGVNVDHASDWVVCVEGAHVSLEGNRQ